MGAAIEVVESNNHLQFNELLKEEAVLANLMELVGFDRPRRLRSYVKGLPVCRGAAAIYNP